MDTKKENLGSEIYSGAASFGRGMAIFGAVMSTLIGIGMVIGGIYILLHKDKSKHVLATVVGCSIDGASGKDCCTSFVDYNGFRQYDCNLRLNYTVNGKEYNNPLYISSQRGYVSGDFLKISYDEKNPNSIKADVGYPYFLGWVLIGLAVLVIAGSWFWVWLTGRYKFAAAVGGARGAWDLAGPIV